MLGSFLVRVASVAVAFPIGAAVGFAVCYTYALSRGLSCLVLRVPTPTEGIDAIAVVILFVVILFVVIGFAALPTIVLAAGWSVGWWLSGTSVVIAFSVGVVQTSRRAYRYHKWRRARRD